MNTAILKNEANAEDVLQEAVQRILIRNRLLPTTDQLTMYLGRAVLNAAKEKYHHRKRERIRQIAINEQILLHENAPSPYAYMEEKEKSTRKERMLQLLREGLRKLPQKQQEAVRIIILESNGRSIRDMGEYSGIPYSTLRHRSRQGIRMLRKYILSKMRKSGQKTAMLEVARKSGAPCDA